MWVLMQALMLRRTAGFQFLEEAGRPGKATRRVPPIAGRAPCSKNVNARAMALEQVKRTKRNTEPLAAQPGKPKFGQDGSTPARAVQRVAQGHKNKREHALAVRGLVLEAAFSTSHAPLQKLSIGVTGLTPAHAAQSAVTDSNSRPARVLAARGPATEAVQN